MIESCSDQEPAQYQKIGFPEAGRLSSFLILIDNLENRYSFSYRMSIEGNEEYMDTADEIIHQTQLPEPQRMTQPPRLMAGEFEVGQNPPSNSTVRPLCSQPVLRVLTGKG